MRCIIFFIVILALVIPVANVKAVERTISHDEMQDKLTGYWIGQLLGNYIGFPFENNWVDEAVPVFVDRIYTYKDDKSLRISVTSRKGFIPIMCDSVHPTITYAVMISAAFFEKDVEKLVQMAMEAVPDEGPFAEGMRDVVKWRCSINCPHKNYRIL